MTKPGESQGEDKLSTGPGDLGTGLGAFSFFFATGAFLFPRFPLSENVYVYFIAAEGER